MKIGRVNMFVTMLVAAAAIAIAAGCGTQGGDGSLPPPPIQGKSIALTPYEGCGELRAEIKEMLIGLMEENFAQIGKSCRYVPRNEGGGGDEVEVAYESPGGDSGGDTSTDSFNEPVASGTNVQEAGVDEADLIKSNGTHVFAMVGNEVKIIRAWPFAEFGEAARIEADGTARGVYLKENRLAVLSEQYPRSSNALADDSYSERSHPVVILRIFDVAEPESPALVNRAELPGLLVGSRRIDSKIHLAIGGNQLVLPVLDYSIDHNILPECPASGEVEPTGQVLAAIEALRQKNLRTIENLEVEDMLPFAASDHNAFCGSLMRSGAAYGTKILSLVTDDMDDSEGARGVVSIMGSGGTVYSSTSGLYIAAERRDFGWWSDVSGGLEESTVFHRFSLVGGLPSYAGSAEVEGHLVDNSYVGSRSSSRYSMAQFAMSEHLGFFRIATTIGNVSRDGASASEGRVYVFRATEAGLEPTGQIGNLGRGERIYAVRFAGDKGYVVTFKKVDPLYVLDLSDPADPKVAGELHMPGFSTYLHPLDEDHVIGLGFDADDQRSFAWTQGLKVALFDVSDPTNPAEVGHRVLGSRGSYSTAVEEHHAFTLDRSRGILALPIDLYEGSRGGSTVGTHSHEGVVLMKVDLGGNFDTIGEVVIEDGMNDDYYWWSYSANVLRTIIIGDGADDGVITLTRSGVYLHRIGDEVSEVGRI